MVTYCLIIPSVFTGIWFGILRGITFIGIITNVGIVLCFYWLFEMDL